MTDATPENLLHPAVRPATIQDCPAILRLITELAVYERSAHLVKTTLEQLEAALFGAQPAVYALVADDGGDLAGFALYFLNFSTWEGVHGIYLEDLYVSPAHRGTGLGRALLASLAAIASDRGYARFEWSVLDWNQPSIDFYAAMGAVAMDGWMVYRLDGEALATAAALARRHPEPGSPSGR